MAVVMKDIQGWRSRTAGFAGGLNIRDPANLLAYNELALSENVILDGVGGLAKRMGTLNLGPYTSDPTEVGISCYTYYRDPPDVPTLVVQTNKGRLYYSFNGTDWFLVSYYPSGGSGPVIVSTTQPCSFEVMNSILYFAEGTGIWGFDGGFTHQVSGAPVGVKYLKIWKERMWAAGDEDLADRVYASAPEDPTTWDPLEFTDIRKGDDDQIMGLFTDGQFLCVGKLRTVSVIYDPNTMNNRVADEEKGLESHHSVVHFDDGLYYLSRLGVCSWQGDAPGVIISSKLDRLFRPDLINFTKTQNAWAYFLDDRVGWLLPERGQDKNSLAIEYYPRYGAISQLTGRYGIGPWMMHRMPVQCLSNMRAALTDQFPNNTESLFGPHPTQNKSMEAFAPNVGTDDGQPFISRVEIAPFDLSDGLYTRSLRRMAVTGRGKFYLQLRRDNTRDVYQVKFVDLDTGFTADDVWDATDEVWSDDLWSQPYTVGSTILNFDARGQSFSIGITDANPEAGHELKDIAGMPTLIPAGRWAFVEAVSEGFVLGLRGV